MSSHDIMKALPDYGTVGIALSDSVDGNVPIYLDTHNIDCYAERVKLNTEHLGINHEPNGQDYNGPSFELFDASLEETTDFYGGGPEEYTLTGFLPNCNQISIAEQLFGKPPFRFKFSCGKYSFLAKGILQEYGVTDSIDLDNELCGMVFHLFDSHPVIYANMTSFTVVIGPPDKKEHKPSPKHKNEQKGIESWRQERNNKVAGVLSLTRQWLRSRRSKEEELLENSRSFLRKRSKLRKF